MISSEAVKYTLGQRDLAVMLQPETNMLLGYTSEIAAMKCEQMTINSNQDDPITFGGVTASTLHANIRKMLVTTYAVVDSLATYTSTTMDEGDAIANVRLSGSVPDVAYVTPMTFSAMFPQLQALFDNSDLQVLHLSIRCLVPRYNLPTVVQTYLQMMQPSPFPLKIDMETLTSVFLGDITNWTDSRIASRIPALLEAFTRTAAPSEIHLVMYGQAARDTSKSTLSNHLWMGLNGTDAFKNSLWAANLSSFPIDWTPVINHVTALGIRSYPVASEDQMEEVLGGVEGGVGYVLGTTNQSNPYTDWSIVKSLLAEDGQTTIEYEVAPTTAAAYAVANDVTPTQDISWAWKNAHSTSWAHRDAWPLPIIHSAVIATDISTSFAQNGGLNPLTLCFRQTRAAKFAQFIATSDKLTVASIRVGRATFSARSEWVAFFNATLNQITCEGQPILYNAPVIWSMPQSTILFGQVLSAVGIVLVIGGIFFVWTYRRRTIVRSANILMQLTCLGGGLFLFLATGLYTFPITNATCGALGWFLFLGCPMMFIPLCCKILRVYLMHAKAAKKTLRKTRHLASIKVHAINTSWVMVHVILLIVTQVKWGGLIQTLTVSQFDGVRDHYYTQCSVSSDAMPYAISLFAADAVAILLTAGLAFTVRHVSSAFGESRNISYALWNAVLSLTIITPLMIFTGGMQSDVGAFLMEFLAIYLTTVTLLCTFAPKAYALLMEELEMAKVAREAASLNSHSGGTSSMGKGATTSNGTSWTTGSGSYTSGSGIFSAFTFPPLDGVGLQTIEKYILAIETQITLARAKRKEMFGSDSPIGSMAAHSEIKEPQSSWSFGGVGGSHGRAASRDRGVIGRSPSKDYGTGRSPSPNAYKPMSSLARSIGGSKPAPSVEKDVLRPTNDQASSASTSPDLTMAHRTLPSDGSIKAGGHERVARNASLSLTPERSPSPKPGGRFSYQPIRIGHLKARQSALVSPPSPTTAGQQHPSGAEITQPSTPSMSAATSPLQIARSLE